MVRIEFLWRSAYKFGLHKHAKSNRVPDGVLSILVTGGCAESRPARWLGKTSVLLRRPGTFGSVWPALRKVNVPRCKLIMI